MPLGPSIGIADSWPPFHCSLEPDGIHMQRIRYAYLLVLLPALVGCSVAGAAGAQDDRLYPDLPEHTEQELAGCLEATGVTLEPPASDEGEWLASFLGCADELGVRDRVFEQPTQQQQELWAEQHNDEVEALIGCLRASDWAISAPTLDEDGLLVLDTEAHADALATGERADFIEAMERCAEAEAAGPFPADGHDHDHDHDHDHEGEQ